jgi:phosphopantetheine attachment domain protein
MFIKYIEKMEEVKQDIEQRIISLINERYWIIEDCEIDSNIYNMGFDDLDYIEFVMDIEKEFGIYISDEELDGLDTPRKFIDLVFEKY